MKLHMIRLSTFDSNAQINYAIWVAILSTVATLSNIIFVFKVPYTVPLFFGFVLFVLVISARYSLLLLLTYLQNKENEDENQEQLTHIAIYGAGLGGRQLLFSLKKNSKYKPVFFIDDNKSLEGTLISGLQVINKDKLDETIIEYDVKKIFLAIPALSPTRKKTIVESLKHLNCEVKALPTYMELIETGDILKSLRPVETEELLGRQKVNIDSSKLSQTYSGQSIFVSGAGGSIGSQLCRQLSEITLSKLILYELNEFSLYKLEMELKPIAEKQGFELICILGSTLDREILQHIFTTHKVDIVLHAAAYKHVPLIETNEIVAARNNILGTKVLAETCINCNIKRFTLISTDKAVRPTNVMGASKRFAEMIIQSLSQKHKETVFSIVRFGNVLGSSGSVIPLFRQQIINGGPITLTNTHITRYFMTIPEAAKLVLIASSFAKGGEIYILDMGKPVRIEELARKMVILSGLSVKDENNPNGDIAIDIVGLRPGEKMYEELSINDDISPTKHPKIMHVQENNLPQETINTALQAIENAISDHDSKQLRTVLSHHIERYDQMRPPASS